MKTKMTKMLSFLISLLMLLSIFAGCNKRSAESETSSSANGIIGESNGNSVSTDPYYDNYEKDDLPADLNYGGYEFTILCDQAQYGKSFADVYTGDTINSAIFERSKVVEERLKITFNVIRELGGYNNMTDFVQKLTAAGENYDLVLAYNLTPATMAIQGFLYDMNKTEYINFDKPWWGEELLQNVSIGNKVFFTGDNSSWNNLRNMLGVFVDKQMFADKHSGMSADDLYDLVENKQWTMEKMFELVANTYEEKDNIEGVSAGDVFGLSCGNSVWMEAWYFAAGFLTLEQNTAGEWDFSIGTTRSVDFVDWFKSKYYGNNDCYKFDPEQYAMFKEGRVQFYVSALSMVEQGLKQEFAVLPLPMYDAEIQNGYKTHFSNTYDMYCIPIQTADPNRSSAVLECLASEAYRRIAPAYFETYLKQRNVSDDRLQKMYDIIRDGIVFDSGVLFGELFIENDNPVYFVRRALLNSAGWENLGSKWNSGVNQQYLELWEQTRNKLNELQ